MKTAFENQLSFFETEIEDSQNSYKEFCQALAGKENLSPDEFGVALQKWSKENIVHPINIVALFSGAGGLDIGFCDTGFNLIESVELINKFAETMEINQQENGYFKNAKILCEDIRKYEPNINKKIDFVIGGPPCQSFSAAGRRAAGVSGTKDDRGNLFQEYVRVLKELKPKGFLFENVYGLLGAEKGESIKKIVQAFKDIGFNVSYKILDAADYGVPQHRERLIIVGLKDGVFKFPKPTHGPDAKNGNYHYSAENAIALLNNPIDENFKPLNGRFGHLLSEVPPGLNYSYFTEKMGHPSPIFAWRSKFSDFLYKADPLSPIRTLKASGGQYTGPFHWNNRHFTIDELKLLQTFPAQYKILGNRAIASKQIGNSVPPQFARLLALSVLNQVFDIKLPFELQYLGELDKLTFRKLKNQKTNTYLKKASSAISNLDVNIKEVLPRNIKVTLKENFKLVETKSSDVEIKFTPKTKKWEFRLITNKKSKELFRINITRLNNSPLFYAINEVTLISDSLEYIHYAILWKVFEKELANNQIKADLVQFNGYYQYSNNINYELIKTTTANNNIWRVIELILLDSKIGQIRNIGEFANDYDMPEDELIAAFFELRKIGFEIRNSNTNPEIPDREFLIPYKFPTLTHQSVQLNKSL